MSTFVVHAPLVHAAATTVSQISPSIDELHGRASRHSDAAKGTPAAHGLSDLTAHWAAVLPAFAEAGSGLAAALHAAAENYQVADQNVAGAAADLPVQGDGR